MATYSDMYHYSGDPSGLAKTVKDYIDKRFVDMTEGKTDPVFRTVTDASLIFELIARGYQVSKPQP